MQQDGKWEPEHGGEEKGYRNWIGTLNNWNPETLETLRSLKNCEWIANPEKGEKTGTPHLQVCLMFRSARKWKHLREKIGEYWFAPAKNKHAVMNY